MKQVSGTLMILAAAAAPSFGQSMLKVSLTDRRPITVSVDGRHFKKGGESVTVGDLPKGRHYVMVYIAETTRDGRRADGVVWEGKVKTYRGQLSLCMVDPRTREANITEQDMYTMPVNQPTDAQYNNHNLGNYDNKPVGGGYDDQQNGYQQNNNGSNSTPDNSITQVPDGSPAASPVTEYNEDELLKGDKKSPAVSVTKGSARVEKIKKEINKRTTDTDKLATAKDELKSGSLTTTDVMAVMDCFSFESTKVEFAQWAYPKTSDKANFKKVKQKLTMKNYREDMDDFLRK